MKKFYLVVFSILFLLACNSSNKEEGESAERGYIGYNVKDLKSNCWWCGNYKHKKGGNWPENDQQRICFPYKTTCPQNATLGDGSTWSRIGKCRCDG